MKIIICLFLSAFEMLILLKWFSTSYNITQCFWGSLRTHSLRTLTAFQRKVIIVCAFPVSVLLAVCSVTSLDSPRSFF